MYKYVCGVLEAFWLQHSSKANVHNSRCFQSSGKTEKRLNNDDSCKPIKVQKALTKNKQLAQSKKRRAFFLYAILWNRLVNPLLELFTPGINQTKQLSKLSDFRTHHGFSLKADSTSKPGEEDYSKCLEEPKPLNVKRRFDIEDYIIKDPREVVKSKNVNMASKKIWEYRNKSKIHFTNSRIISKSKDRKKSFIYNLLLKKVFEPKVERLMPSIHSDQLSQLWDFRNQETSNIECDQLGISETSINCRIEKVSSVDMQVEEQVGNLYLNKDSISGEILNSSIGKTNVSTPVDVESIQETFAGPINTQTGKYVSKPVTEEKFSTITKKPAETINIGKKKDNLKTTNVKVRSELNVHHRIKPPSKKIPPLPKVLDKRVNLKEDVIKQLNRINTVTTEQGAKDKQDKSITQSTKGKPIAQRYSLAADNNLSKGKLNKKSNESSFSKSLNVTDNEKAVRRKSLAENHSSPESQQKAVVAQHDALVSELADNKLDATSLNKQDVEFAGENLLQEKSPDFTREEDEKFSRNGSNYNNKSEAEAVKECKEELICSDQLNEHYLVGISRSTTSQTKAVKLEINKRGDLKTVSAVENSKENLIQQTKITEKENKTNFNEEKETSEFINGVHNKHLKDLVKPGNSSVSTSTVVTYRTVNDVESGKGLKLKAVEEKHQKKQNPKNSLSEETCAEGSLKTRIVSFDTSGDEGCLVTQELDMDKENKADLVDINMVVEKENTSLMAKNVKAQEQSYSKTSKNKENQYKSSPISWKRGKKDLEVNVNIAKLTDANSTVENSTSNSHISNDDIKQKMTKSFTASIVSNANTKLTSASSSSTNINVNQKPPMKTTSLEGVAHQNKQESKVESAAKVTVLKPVAPINTNQTAKKSEKITDIMSNILKESQNVKSKLNEVKKSKSENLLNTNPEVSIKVLNATTMERVKDAIKKDKQTQSAGIQDKQISIVENKKQSLNIKEDLLKQNVLKGKTNSSSNNVVDDVKHSKQNEDGTSNDISPKGNLKAQNIMRRKTFSDYSKEVKEKMVKSTDERKSLKTNRVGKTNQNKEENLKLKIEIQADESKEKNNIQQKNISVDKSTGKLASASKDGKLLNKRVGIKESKESPVTENTKTTGKLEQKTENKVNIKHNKTEKPEELKETKSSSEDKNMSIQKSSTTLVRNNSGKTNIVGNIRQPKSDSADNSPAVKQTQSKMEVNNERKFPKPVTSDVDERIEEVKSKVNEILNNFVVTGQKQKTAQQLNRPQIKEQPKQENHLDKHKANPKVNIVRSSQEISKSLENVKKEDLKNVNSKIWSQNINKTTNSIRPTFNVPEDHKNQNNVVKNIENQTAERLKTIAKVLSTNKQSPTSYTVEAKKGETSSKTLVRYQLKSNEKNKQNESSLIGNTRNNIQGKTKPVQDTMKKRSS